MNPNSGHAVASRGDWLEARKELLRKEKALTRARDQLAAERRALPWVKVDKVYRFQSTRGTETLGDLFGRNSQLIVQHFMFGPGWSDGCVGCSFAADHVDAAWVHLRHHDVGFVAVARAPFPELEAFQRRMGWKFKWVSSHGSDFNYDFHVSFSPEDVARGQGCYNYEQREVGEELPGLSVFCRNEAGEIFHTYSAFARGAEEVVGAYMFLDLTPLGRNEDGNMTGWVRHHDRYGDPSVVVDPDGRARRVGPGVVETVGGETRT